LKCLSLGKVNKSMKTLFSAIILVSLMTISIRSEAVSGKPKLWNASPMKEYTFHVKEKKRQYKNIIKIQNKHGVYYYNSILTEKGEQDIVADAKLNMDFETLEWREINPRKNINVVAVRKGNVIFLTGTFDNKHNNKKEIYIDERKWQQIYQLSMMRFAAKQSKENWVEFWCLNPDRPGNAMVLSAVKKKKETIELYGEKMEAQKLRISIAGFLSMFWSGNYWYRPSDGFFVRAKISGDVFVELRDEKNEKKL